MTRLAQIITALFVWLAGFACLALGTMLCVMAIVGWMGVEIREWTFRYYFSGGALILLGFGFIYGVNSFFEEVEA